MLHSSLDKLESYVLHTHIHMKGGNNGCQNVASRGSYLDTRNPLLSQRDSKSQRPLLCAPPNLSAEENATHLQQPRSLPLCLCFMCSPTEERAAQAHSRAEFLTSLMKLWRSAVCQIILVQSCLYCSLLLRYFSLFWVRTSHYQPGNIKKQPSLLFILYAVTFQRTMVTDKTIFFSSISEREPFSRQEALITLTSSILVMLQLSLSFSKSITYAWKGLVSLQLCANYATLWYIGFILV